MKNKEIYGLTPFLFFKFQSIHAMKTTLQPEMRSQKFDTVRACFLLVSLMGGLVLTPAAPEPQGLGSAGTFAKPNQYGPKRTDPSQFPMAYQRRKDGIDLAEQINSILMLENVRTADTGSYTPVVTNTVVSVTSQAATLTVLEVPPIITQQPTNQAVLAGATATFSVASAGPLPQSYQWQFNGAKMTGATDKILTLTNVDYTQAGSYAVVISNSFGSVTSNVATLAVDVPPRFLWARKAGGDEGDGFQALAVDASGNLYLAGVFSGTGTFGDTSLTSVGGMDIFVAKLDSNGNFLWTKQAGGPDYDFASGVAVDASGNVYVTGCYARTATFGTTTLESIAGSTDIFLLKMNSSGTVLWVRWAGASGYDEGRAVTIDRAGNAYVTGSFMGSGWAFGAWFSSYGGSPDIIVAKLDPNGNFLSGVQAGGSNSDWGQSVAVDGEGNVYFAGVFTSSPAYFPSGTFYTSGGYDLFLAKADSSANFRWAARATGTGSEEVRALATDGAGNVYLAGSFAGDSASGGTATFGNTTLTSSGYNDVFLAKADSNGSFKWARKAGGSVGDLATALAVDSDTNVYLAGWFYSAIASFGDVTVTNSGSADVFLTKADSDGNFLWTLKSTGSGHEVCSGVGVDSVGNVLLAGSFSGTAMFGTNALMSSGGGETLDAFLVKVAVSPPFITRHPSAATASAGSSVAFEVAAVGKPPISYQWQLNGTNIIGATNTTLTLNSVQPSDAGNYTVVVTNASGSVTSHLATLTVTASSAIPVVVYTNDFEGAVGAEWSNSKTETTPVGNRKFLGQFSNQTVSFTLTNLPTHNIAVVSFDLLVIRSWDGYLTNNPGDQSVIGPDFWQANVSGARYWCARRFPTTKRKPGSGNLSQLLMEASRFCPVPAQSKRTPWATLSMGTRFTG
jgi:hypothetical protein